MITRPGEMNWDGRDDERDPYQGPWTSNEEAKTSQAILSNTLDSKSLRNIRPAIPVIQLNPPRFGYRTRQLAITDIVDGNMPTPRMDYSGTSGSYAGTSRMTSDTLGDVG